MSTPTRPQGDRPPSNRTGAVAADTRRKRPAWLLWLLGLLGLLLLALLLFFLLHGSGKKKAAAAVPGPAVSSAPSQLPSSAAPSPVGAGPSVAPSSAGTGAATGAGAGGAALVGGGGVPVKTATGSESGTAGSSGAAGSGSAAAGTPQGTVLFASSSAALDANARKVITEAAARIKAQHPAKVTVTGYTDVVGGQPTNDGLSQKRADAVAAALKADLGATPTVTATAKGPVDPVGSNSTAAGRQQNRRASITTE